MLSGKKPNLGTAISPAAIKFPFPVHRLSAIVQHMADDQQKPTSPFVASWMIRGIAFTFLGIWLFHVLYVDPTRGSVNLAVSRIYLSVSGLFIFLALAFYIVASSVKRLEKRLQRLEQTNTVSKSE